MAKAKAETTFWLELLNARLFKPNQGRVVRQVTALAVAGIFAAVAWRLHSTILSDASTAVRNSVSSLIAIAGCWIAYRLVNWPQFANFLISVEAEMDKVSWASWEYLKRATMVVLVTMVALGGYLYFCDLFWGQLFNFIGFLDLQSLN